MKETNVHPDHRCVRCSGVILKEDQLCPRGTLAALHCWRRADVTEIGPGLCLGPGSAPAAPLVDLGADPYLEDWK